MATILSKIKNFLITVYTLILAAIKKILMAIYTVILRDIVSPMLASTSLILAYSIIVTMTLIGLAIMAVPFIFIYLIISN